MTDQHQNRKITVQPGDLFVAPNGERHRVLSSQGPKVMIEDGAGGRWLVNKRRAAHGEWQHIEVGVRRPSKRQKRL